MVQLCFHGTYLDCRREFRSPLLVFTVPLRAVDSRTVVRCQPVQSNFRGADVGPLDVLDNLLFLPGDRQICVVFGCVCFHGGRESYESADTVEILVNGGTALVGIFIPRSKFDYQALFKQSR